MSRRCWDALVLGAGPAGALAARVLARRGFAVLLLDRSEFPRGKVCGCCLNASALQTLSDCGLGELADKLNAQSLTGLQLFVGGESGRIELPGARVLSREALDAALVREAQAAGAVLLTGAVVHSSFLNGDTRRVRVQTSGSECEFSAKLVLAATGLNSAYLDTESGLQSVIAPGSRMGLGASVSDAPEFYAAGSVFMACAEGGYAGLVRLEDGRLNIAAALDQSYLRGFFEPGRALAEVLRQAGVPPIAALATAQWHGTPLLTRQRSKVAAQRLWVLGDAAGYVEPFTGEGMAWALLSGLRAATLAPEIAELECWDEKFERRWNDAYRNCVARQQLSCKVVSKILRAPRLARAALGVLQAVPELSRAVLRRMERPALGAA